MILTPSLLMTTMLTRSPAKTLLLQLAAGRRRWPRRCCWPWRSIRWRFCCKRVVTKIYPVNEQVAEQLRELLGGEMPLGLLLLVVAVVPAICEELAFRGFILSGLRHLGHKWRAIILTSIFFGVTHPIFQQSLVACDRGRGVGLHRRANRQHSARHRLPHGPQQPGRAGAAGNCPPGWPTIRPCRWLVTFDRSGAIIISRRWRWCCRPQPADCMLVWFQRLAYARTKEESLQEAIEQQPGRAAVSGES